MWVLLSECGSVSGGRFVSESIARKFPAGVFSLWGPLIILRIRVNCQSCNCVDHRVFAMSMSVRRTKNIIMWGLFAKCSKSSGLDGRSNNQEFVRLHRTALPGNVNVYKSLENLLQSAAGAHASEVLELSKCGWPAIQKFQALMFTTTEFMRDVFTRKTTSIGNVASDVQGNLVRVWRGTCSKDRKGSRSEIFYLSRSRSVDNMSVTALQESTRG